MYILCQYIVITKYVVLCLVANSDWKLWCPVEIYFEVGHTAG